MTLPISERSCRTSAQSRVAAGPTLSTPAVMSEWPPRYFVAEWKAKSAPSSSAREVQGGATVQSTASRAPAACAASAAAAMSITSQVGLVGLSIQRSRVRPGRSAASSAPGLGRVEERRLDPAQLAEPPQPGGAAVIHRPRRRHVVARPQRLGQRHQRRHAAGEDQRVRRALEVGEHRLGVLAPSARRRGRRCRPAAARRRRRARRSRTGRSPASPSRSPDRSSAAPAPRGWRATATSGSGGGSSRDCASPRAAWQAQARRRGFPFRPSSPRRRP